MLDSMLATAAVGRSVDADHRLPRPLHDRAGRASEVPRPAARAAEGSAPAGAVAGGASATTRSARRIETNQLKLQRERGADITIFSPRASAMAHHVGDEATSAAWTRACNDLIKRVVDLYPENFVGVCQLPQSPGVPIANSIARAASAA